MMKSATFFESMGLPVRDGYELLPSGKTFADGAQYRIEIPSVEGPGVMEAVIKEANRFGITVNRVSQGSGIMLQTDDEIRSMAEMGRDSHIEVCLFIGPRMSFDTSALVQANGGKTLGWRHGGMDQVLYAMEDVYRAVHLGIRSLLIADEGLLWLIDQAKKRGELPPDLVLKVSASISPANPVSVRVYETMGGTTVNIPGDLSLPRISSIRQVVDCPLDMYIESADDMGGFVRHYEIPEIVKIAAPVYLKFGLRNAAGVYPSGMHVENAAVSQCREKVRRAYIGVEMLNRYSVDARQTVGKAADLGVPN
ncbi:U32 family peptidase [Paenibacillus sp. MBLB4367]|uniref:U32 family peptidase n=1 Tax=Paenibacillus sp. MBLB4367 TaxID=3384767 RepID=UPI003907E97E